jgi:osmotically-inducible protein OsmY
MIGTGVTVCGYAAVRDKDVADSLRDTKLETKIKGRLYKISPDLYSDASVIVDRGCVLLTGVVRNQDWVVTAEKESWAVDRVISVDNCLSFGEQLSVSRVMKDGVITSSCKSSLLCERNVRSVNYKIKTTNGIVYVLGVARSQSELNLVLSRIQSVDGVKKIVSFVNVLKNG